jgi:hypothetical protein
MLSLQEPAGIDSGGDGVIVMVGFWSAVIATATARRHSKNAVFIISFSLSRLHLNLTSVSLAQSSLKLARAGAYFSTTNLRVAHFSRSLREVGLFKFIRGKLGDRLGRSPPLRWYRPGVWAW